MYEKEIAEIQKFLREIKKTNIFLSPKDKKILIYFLREKKFPTEKLKNLILQELKKYPSEKRRKISLYQLLKNVENSSEVKEIYKEKKAKKSSQIQTKIHSPKRLPEQWKVILKNIPEEIWKDTDFSDELSILELKNKLINYYWKNLTEQEKQKIKEKAVLKIKKMKLPSKVDKETLKSFIAEVIKEEFKIPD